MNLHPPALSPNRARACDALRLVLGASLLSIALIVSACSDDSSPPEADGAQLDLTRDLLPADSGLDLTVDMADLAPAEASTQGDLLVGESVPRPDIFAQAPPALNTVTLLVNLGDSIAAGYGVPQGASYRALLIANDDQTYPEFAGKDLRHLYPQVGFADLAWPGATSEDLADQLSNSPSNQAGQTLVVISVGGNDLLFNFALALDPQLARAKAQEVVTRFQAVAAHFADQERYPGGAALVILNVYDPTDGMASFPPSTPVTGTCADAAPYLDLVGSVLLQSLEAYNQEIASFVLSSDVLLADSHALFLGHGFHHGNPGAFFYVPEDPTLWFALDCIHPNIQGHHAIRRLLWHILFENK